MTIEQWRSGLGVAAALAPCGIICFPPTSLPLLALLLGLVSTETTWLGKRRGQWFAIAYSLILTLFWSFVAAIYSSLV